MYMSQFDKLTQCAAIISELTAHFGNFLSNVILTSVHVFLTF